MSATSGCLGLLFGGSSGGGNVSAGGVGSGFAYEQPAITREDATHIATTPDQFDAALDEATRENPSIVWLPADAAINYSGRSRIVTNAVIASSRSVNHPGGLIYSNTMGGTSEAYRGGPVDGVLELGSNSRMTGVRYRGPTSATWNSQWYPGYIPFGSGNAAQREEYRSQRHSRGLNIVSGNARVDNCEIFGWSTMAISVNCPPSWNREREQSYPRISNCSIHDNMMSGFGYCIEVNVGHPIVQRCFLNAARHMMAGEGLSDGGYTISESFVGPAASLFALDYHYNGENITGSSDPAARDYRYRSGGLIRILNTTVAYSHVIRAAATSSISQGGNPFAGNQTPAVHIGGVPAKKCLIQGCRFVHGSREEAITQGHIPPHIDVNEQGYGRIIAKNNQYGLRTSFSVGQP
ncbi:hypothetical protein [Halalkalicoccus subterraneus]|uniref:hypothetical protein n=1 Tax=Halalkalicoccus subterraneus TaxID=2675002 RepID=UPI001FE2F196|nr:hypothetical protein [Halalkalicoccus subterraneus]